MKKKLLFNLLNVISFVCISSPIYAQVGTNFSEPAASSNVYKDTNTATHQLINNANQPTVEYIYGTNGSSELGFKTRFIATRTGTSGAAGLGAGTDPGDLVGVVTAATLNSSSGFTIGTGNVFMIEDSDGTVQIEFDQVDLTGTTNPQLSLKYGINSTSYETGNGSNDRLFIALKVEGNANLVTILDSDGDGTLGGSNATGNDIDGQLTEEAEQTLNFSLVPYIGQKVSLIIEGDTNSTSEEFAFDDISFSEGSRVPSTSTWAGTTSNDWGTASNWSPSSIPSASSDVVIPNGLTNYPTISSAVTVNSITIASGASLIANAAVTGNTTYTRNLPTTNWYLVSAPVSGETREDVIANHTFASGSGSNIGIGAFTNNGVTPWVYASSSSTGALVSGGGVSMKLAAAGNVSITGSVNTTNVSFPIATGSRNNFNLVGNPFTSFVSSSTFATANTGLLSEETIWLWNGSQYVTYNAVNPIQIAPAQGFFVEANGSGNITFSTANQSHQGSDTFLRTISNPSFELFINDGTNQKSTKVFYVDNKTKGFDNGYDSKMFGGVSESFAVYTELLENNEGKRLAIQTLPNSNLETMVIPVGLIANANNEVTFSATGKNLPTGVEIYLEDKLENTITNLTEGNHTLTLKNAANSSGRFYVHVTAQRLSNEDILNNFDNVSIYKSAKQELTINGLQGKATVKIYSVLGKEVSNTVINSSGNSKISLPELSTGIYVVRLSSDLGRLTKKIILK